MIYKYLKQCDRILLNKPLEDFYFKVDFFQRKRHSLEFREKLLRKNEFNQVAMKEKVTPKR